MKVDVVFLDHVGTNCYIVTDEKTGEGAVIDPGEYSEKLLKAIDRSGAEIKTILLTHGHYDHILGVYDLREQTGAKVYIHGRDALCLFDEDESLMGRMGKGIQTPCHPDKILADGDTVKVGSIEMSVLYTPGHTKGSVCFVCEDERVIFTGDTIFAKTYGRYDLPGGDFDELVLSFNRLKLLHGDYILYPGHGASTTLDKERSWNMLLKKI